MKENLQEVRNAPLIEIPRQKKVVVELAISQHVYLAQCGRPAPTSGKRGDPLLTMMGEHRGHLLLSHPAVLEQCRLRVAAKRREKVTLRGHLLLFHPEVLEQFRRPAETRERAVGLRGHLWNQAVLAQCLLPGEIRERAALHQTVLIEPRASLHARQNQESPVKAAQREVLRQRSLVEPRVSLHVLHEALVQVMQRVV